LTADTTPPEATTTAWSPRDAHAAAGTDGDDDDDCDSGGGSVHWMRELKPEPAGGPQGNDALHTDVDWKSGFTHTFWVSAPVVAVKHSPPHAQLKPTHGGRHTDVFSSTV
jgi:hypothetical protein